MLQSGDIDHKRDVVISLLNKIIALKCVRCINTGEPAAVFGFPLPIKVVEETRPESAAAGLLFDFLPQSSQREQRKR